MPEERWGILRDRITDHRQGRSGLVARCMACESKVFIRTAPRNGRCSPLFVHYVGGDSDCPWHQGRNMRPDDARANQYQGKQESNFHRLMCEQIAALVQLDPRYIGHSVAQYLPPTENNFGRYPDVYVQWQNVGRFVVEFQMSQTFQTEISARCKHYEHEDIPLLWILFGIDTHAPLPQNFSDVIRRHRGNAFVLDAEAVAASKDQETLVLKCYLRSGDRFEPPRLVRFDELTIPRSRIPYFEDRLSKRLLADIRDRRAPWFDELNKWDHYARLKGLDRPQSLLVAAAFSIVSAANGNEKNYASNHSNVRGMLNAYLNTGSLSGYAELLSELIQNTTQRDLLQGTVGDHLRRSTKSAPQSDRESEEWQLLKELLPEALDSLTRSELTYLDALPTWAIP